MEIPPKILPPLGQTPEEILAALETLPEPIDMDQLMKVKYQEKLDSIPDEWNLFVESLGDVDGIPWADKIEGNRIQIGKSSQNHVIFGLDHSSYPPLVVSGTFGMKRMSNFSEEFMQQLVRLFLNPEGEDHG